MRRDDDDFVGAEGLGHGEAVLVDVGDDDPRGSECAGGEHRDEADRAGSHDERRRLRADLGAAAGVDSHAEGLTHRSFFQAHILRQLEAEIRRVHYLFQPRTQGQRRSEI